MSSESKSDLTKCVIQSWFQPFNFQPPKELPESIIFNALLHRDWVSKEAAKSSKGLHFAFPTVS